jgi:hypothetical protein
MNFTDHHWLTVQRKVFFLYGGTRVSVI